MSETESTHDSRPMVQETSFQRDALAAIARLESPHGLAVKEALERHYDKEIHHGRIYPNLDELVEKGLVEKSKKDLRTNEYQITARGRRELQADAQWRQEAVEMEAKR